MTATGGGGDGPAPVPVRVDVQRASGLELEWDDGSRSRFSLEELRTNCPCAACRAARERGRPAWQPSPLGPALAVSEAELVGGWGVSIRWSDGHATGIYSWDVLRRWRSHPC